MEQTGTAGVSTQAGGLLTTMDGEAAAPGAGL